jgi:hypothetical protein
MNRIATILFLLAVVFLSTLDAQNITLQPLAGQMNCGVRVPGLPRQGFNLGLPETIGSSEGMILNFPEVTIQWEGPDASGIVRHAWLSSGKIEYTLVLTPGSDYVDAVMTVRNLTRAGWTNVFSFNCLNPTGADQFKDWTLERTYMSKNGKPFRMDGTTRVNDGSMSTVQFYLNNNYGPVSPFIQGFKATSPDQTDDSYIVTMSQDGTSYMAATSPRSCYLFDNLDRCCIHSAADFGDIPAGEEKTVTSRFYFAHGSLDDFITRFEAEVKHVQPPRKEKPLVAMCYGNPWVLADTTQWSAVLGKLDILKIYIGDISARLDSQQSRALANALLSHNIKIAVELGGLLDWHASKGDQSAAASFQQDFSNVRPLIDLIKSIDPTRSIDMLDMDGPIRRMLFPSNSAPTNHTLASAVTELSKVVKMWRDSVPGIEINLLTNFPNWAWGSTPSYFAINGRSDGYGRYEDVLDAVEAEKAKSGLYFDGLTVDNPYDYATGKAQTNQPGLIAGVDWMQRLAELDSRAKAMGLKVNMIFNTNGGRTAEGYSDQTLALIDLYHQRVGTPDGYWIQSWYQLPGEWLPESDAYTMTNIVREAMRKIAAQITASGYWGLRNIEMTLPGATFTELNPQYVAWGFVWDRVERPDNTFSWAGLDQAVDFTAQYGARTVFLLTPASSWASDGEARAPNDLDRAIPISDPVPERGYSEALYDYAYNLIDHAAKRNPDVLGYLRYGNEPQYPDHWITTEQTYRQDVDDYIRCLRTAYLAAHKAAADNNAEIKVSHGGFYYYSQLERSWFEYGEAHPEAQDSLVTLFNSHYERQWPLPISSWNDFSRRIQNTTGIPPTYWMDAIAGQTDWLDWFDIHYHFKPRYIFDNMKAFEASVSDSGGTLKPWLAAEAAMQIEAQGETRYEERFHAGDMVRKWIFGMAAGLKGICTPIVGAPPDRFFGLYSDQGDRYMSADAYAFVHSLIQPAAPPIDLSEQGAAAYRFKENSIVDVVWFDALFDTETDVVSYTPVVPEEFANRKTGDLKLQVYDILGLHLATLDVDQAPVIVPISQEPRVLIWQLAAVVDTSLALLEPADGRVYHGMQTMTFEPAGNDPVAGYLSILNGEDIQPAVRGMFFSIPGTRGTALSLRQLGEFYRSADSIGFIPELSLFLVSDIATDSVIAVSNQYDAVIDSIVTLSIAYGKAMFLRIGGEFNGVGEGWNGGGYHPYLYVDMFRKITDKFASRGFRDSVATIWCYYPAAANDFDSTDSRGALWYPGDDYVDWFGLDLFDPQDFDMSLPDYDRRGITRKGKSERFLAMARSKGKPVYMSETSAKGMNISADAADSQADWNEWFAKFFEFITAHQEIKGYSYIDANWPEHAYAGWGDARIENSPDISAWYRDEMHKPKYIHLPATGPTGVTDANPAASSIILHGNYPNPFNPSTTIRFELPRSMQVTLVISDALGRDVRRVINGEIYAAGEHTAVFDARTLPSGVYNYRLVADGAVKIRRMLLLR